MTLAGKSDLKVYKAKEIKGLSLFAGVETLEFTGKTKLPRAGWNNDFNKFASSIGRLPGDSTDDAATVLTNSQ